MPAYVALVRGANVLGSGKLPMAELKAICERAGFKSVRTWIASGNVVFHSRKSAATIKATLETALTRYAGRPFSVHIRTAAEMTTVLQRNPFKQRPGSLTVAFFLDGPPPADALEAVTNRKAEQLRLGQREIYVYYAAGFADSRITIRAAKNGTARNMNTIAKLVEMAASL